MQHRLYKTEALVLRRSSIHEADRLLLIATPQGKRRVIAKGVRKMTSRLAGHIELFTHTSLLLATGRNLDVITQSVVLHSFSSLHHDMSRLACSYYLADLYDALTYEEEHKPLFEHMVAAFSWLDQTSTPQLDVVVRACELRLLGSAGYRPHLFRCAICHDPLTEEATHVSPSLGGVLCPRHQHHDPHALAMSFRAFKVLRYLETASNEDIERVHISPETCDEIESVLRNYLTHMLERPLKTAHFTKIARKAQVL